MCYIFDVCPIPAWSVLARRIDAYARSQAVCTHGIALFHNTTCAWAECAVSAPDVEQRIQHVITGLTGGVVIKGNEHATQTLANRMKELRVPGVSIAVIHQGKIEWARGFGVRSLGGPTIFTADTVFQAGSISKPLAAMAALRMVQEGKLSLDADVNTYLTSWKFPADPVAMGKSITLRELLTHTAGTTVHGFPGTPGSRPDVATGAQRRKACEYTGDPKRSGAWR